MVFNILKINNQESRIYGKIQQINNNNNLKKKDNNKSADKTNDKKSKNPSILKIQFQCFTIAGIDLKGAYRHKKTHMAPHARIKFDDFSVWFW